SKLDARTCFRRSRICPRVHIAHAKRAGVGPHPTLNGAEGAALACSVRAQSAKDLAAVNFEGHAVNCPLRTIADVEVFDLKSQTVRRGLTGGRQYGSQIMRDSRQSRRLDVMWLRELLTKGLRRRLYGGVHNLYGWGQT